MSNNNGILVFYDDSCRHCRQEMIRFKQYDTQGLLTLVDCSDDSFDEFLGIPQQEMMTRNHVYTAEGQWLKGADAVYFLFEYTGFKSMATLWRQPWMRSAYPWLAKNRHILAKLGMAKIMNWLMYFPVRKLEKKQQGCQGGQCDISGK
ncbi:MAG: DUF393 domain-containing protein [Methylococcales bacterium]|jgi:predicted DCC family thiol-disulfide oxidoreductase YuxK|nr:DUF393 domain-containing protein [Methylococcales bacterium]